MKRTLCIILILFLTLSLFACTPVSTTIGTTTVTSGTTGATTATTVGTETTVANVIDPWVKYDPPITVTYAKTLGTSHLDLLAKLGWTENDTIWTQALEKELGIKMDLKWSSPTDDDYATQLSLAAASGNLPDYIYFGTNYSTIRQFYDAGSLADLTDYIEDYAYSGLKNGIEMAGEEIFYPGTFDGRRYTMCSIIGGENSAHGFMYMRADWLTKLGLKVPVTMEDTIALIKAFKDDDPDGNGQDDTIGLMATGSSIPGEFEGIFNCYHAYPDQWIDDGNGGITYGSIQKECKDALAMLANLYTEGYIEKDYFALTNDWRTEAFTSSKAGICFSTQSGMFGMSQLIYDANPESIIWAAPLPAVDNQPIKMQSTANAGVYYGMSAEAEHPEAIVKFFNLHVSKLWDPDTTNVELNYQYGNGEDGNTNGIWQLSMIAYENPGKNADKATLAEEAYKTGDTSKLKIPEYEILYKNLKAVYDDGATNFKGWEATFGFEHSANHYMPEYLSKGLIMPEKFLSAPTTTMNEVQAALDTMEQEAFINIITGIKPVDYFDTFIVEWLAAGGQLCIDEANNWYKSLD